MQQNEPLVAIVAVDTAENEPSEVGDAVSSRAGLPGADLAPISQPNDQPSEGSFSSASKPMFATKCSVFNMCR